MVIKTGNLNKLVDREVTSLGNDILAAILYSAEELMTGKGWLEGINKLLAELGRATSVSRVWVFQTLELQHDYILQDYAFEWHAHKKYKQIGLPHFNRFKSPIVEPEYIALIESRKRGEYQSVMTRTLPDDWLKSHLVSQGVKSMLTLPIIIENQWWGTIGLDDCEREYKWTANDITLLRTASYFISSAIVRDNYRAKQHQLDILKENIACSSWELDWRRGHLWCTSEVLIPNEKQVTRQLFSLRQWLRRIYPPHRKPFLKTTLQFLKSDTSTLRCDLKILRLDGQYCWVEVSSSMAKGNGNINNVIAGICWDITARKRDEERLQHEATTDPLTGLVNRRKFEILMKSHFMACPQPPRPFSFAILDIDFFKSINDRYGHAVGDYVLKQFTQTIRQIIRPSDHFARIGGEEFAILLPDTPPNDATSLLKKICRHIFTRPITHQNDIIHYSVSIGVAVIESPKATADEAFKAADRALYQAKQTGRNRVITVFL